MKSILATIVALAAVSAYANTTIKTKAAKTTTTVAVRDCSKEASIEAKAKCEAEVKAAAPVKAKATN